MKGHGVTMHATATALKDREKFSNKMKLFEVNSELETAIEDYANEQRDADIYKYRGGYRSSRRAVTREFVGRQLEYFDVCLVGDHHPSIETKELFLDVARQYQEMGKNFVIALESVQMKDQGKLDRFMDGDMAENEFRKVFTRGFGFDYRPFKLVFDFAKEHRIKVVAINSEGSLSARDRRAGRKTKELLKEGFKVISLIGDFHLKGTNLPYQIKKLVRAEVCSIRSDAELMEDGDAGGYEANNHNEIWARRTSKLSQNLSFICHNNMGVDINADIYKGMFIDALVDFFGFDDAQYLSSGALSEPRGNLDHKITLYSKKTEDTEDEFLEMSKKSPKYFMERIEKDLENDKNSVDVDGQIFVKSFEPREFSESLGVAIQNLHSKNKGWNYTERWYYEVLESTAAYVASKVFNFNRTLEPVEKITEVDFKLKKEKKQDPRIQGQYLGEELFNALMRDEIPIDLVRDNLFEADYSGSGAAAQIYKTLSAGLSRRGLKTHKRAA